jgi:hypothetical protein
VDGSSFLENFDNTGALALNGYLERAAGLLDARPDDFFATPNAPADVFTDELQYCKRHGLWMHAKKKITGGTLVFCTDTRKMHMVIKNQRIDTAGCDTLDVAPGVWCTELQALIALRFLMDVKGVAPLFCELLHNETYHDIKNRALLSSMRLARYDVNLLDWLTATKCPAKPNINVSADAGDAWTMSLGGGRALATSTHASDVRLFNAILRAIIFQTILALATAQRHVRFCHNDLHIGNVMLSSRMARGVKKFVTGFGTFTLPNHCPTVRLIDFQHVAFDVVRSDGTFARRVRGYPTGWANERGLFYDMWRFCSHLLMEGLHGLWPVVDTDVREFLWTAAQLPGAPAAAPPRIPSERHWTPHLMRGVLPEQALLDEFGPFRCFRGDMHAAAEHTFVERGDNLFPCPAERFVRTVCVQSFPTPRVLARYAERLPPRRALDGSDAALEGALNAYVRNYVKRVDVSLGNMTKFTIRERAAYLFRELEAFQTGMHVLWSLPQAHSARLVAGGPMSVCAAADAVQCALRSDLMWTHRASAAEHVAFFDAVKATLASDTELVKAAATRTPLALPCHGALGEFLGAEHEHHLEQLKGREAQCVARSVYC